MSPPRDIVAFMIRWRKKSKNYNYERLNAFFDGFFTVFVLYNFLYDYICQEDKDRYPESGDRQRSINVARRFLGADVIASDQVIRHNASLLKSLVEEKAFYLRDESWDNTRVAGLDSIDNEEWTKCLLEVLYQIRCNTFHGRKQFQEEQKKILLPSINILGRINDLLIEKLAPGALEQMQAKEPNSMRDGSARRAIN